MLAENAEEWEAVLLTDQGQTLPLSVVVLWFFGQEFVQFGREAEVVLGLNSLVSGLNSLVSEGGEEEAVV